MIMFSLNNPHIYILIPCSRLSHGISRNHVKVSVDLFSASDFSRLRSQLGFLFFDCKKWLSFFMKTLHYLKLVFRL